MTTLLAIDPGNATGIAFRRADGAVMFRTWKLEGVGGGRIIQLDGRLNALHSAERFDRVSYEQPFFSKKFPTAAEPLLDLTGHIKFWAASRGIPYTAYAVAEIKRAVASGRADKRTMIERVRLLGYAVNTDHEADAVAQLLLAMRGITPARQVRKTLAREAARAAGPDLFGTPRRRVA